MNRFVLFPAFLSLTLLSPAGALCAQPRWQVERAAVSFAITNAGLPVHGSFAGLEADVRFDPDAPERSTILASIDAATVETGIGLRDRHLQKRDYFDVVRYPRIRMESVRMEKGASGTYHGTFQLTIKGIRRDVAMPFTFTVHGPRGTFAGRFDVRRSDFGLGGSSPILANAVSVDVTIEVTPQE